jgi:hypothetical protein
VVARIELDRELRELSAQADASTHRGDPNFVLRRAALLHADVAVGPLAARKRVDLVPDQKTPARAGGARQIRLNVFDGREIGLQPRATALREMQFVFELQASPLSHDPWWNYNTAQARNADELLTALRQPFLAEAVR